MTVLIAIVNKPLGPCNYNRLGAVAPLIGGARVADLRVRGLIGVSGDGLEGERRVAPPRPVWRPQPWLSPN